MGGAIYQLSQICLKTQSSQVACDTIHLGLRHIILERLWSFKFRCLNVSISFRGLVELCYLPCFLIAIDFYCVIDGIDSSTFINLTKGI